LGGSQATATYSAEGTFTSPGGSQLSLSGLAGASVSFSNGATSPETVNVWFVWYNTAGQVVSIGAQLGASFAPGQILNFSDTYSEPGTYTVKVFVTDPLYNALSASYSAMVAIP